MRVVAQNLLPESTLVETVIFSIIFTVLFGKQIILLGIAQLDVETLVMLRIFFLFLRYWKQIKVTILLFSTSLPPSYCVYATIYRSWHQIQNVQQLIHQLLMHFTQCMMKSFYIFQCLKKVIYCNYIEERNFLCIYLVFDYFGLKIDGSVVAVVDVIQITHFAVATVSLMY